MDDDHTWAAIDAQRADLADLLDTLTPEQWATPSLCSAWTVREVAAHLTLAQIGAGAAAVAFARHGFSFDRMIRETARRQARLPTSEYAVRLRAMVGSRRTAPGVTPTEPLTDLLVHGQDIAVPLGLDRPVDPALATVSLTRTWSQGFPFHPRRRLAGLRLVATDADWSAGEGQEVAGRAQDLLLLVTGRQDAVADRLVRR